MVRLSKLIENEACWSNRFGLVLYGMVAQKFIDETEEDNSLLEGLCPERLLLSDDWFFNLSVVKVEAANTPHTAYAYYPPEYLEGT